MTILCPDNSRPPTDDEKRFQNFKKWFRLTHDAIMLQNSLSQSNLGTSIEVVITLLCSAAEYYTAAVVGYGHFETLEFIKRSTSRIIQEEKN